MLFRVFILFSIWLVCLVFLILCLADLNTVDLESLLFWIILFGISTLALYKECKTKIEKDEY